MRFAKYLLLVVLTTVATGCVEPIKIHRYPLFTDKGVTLSEAAEAIRSAGELRGWKMTPVAEDRFYATYRFGRHIIMVVVAFDTEAVLVKYKDSVNMRYNGTSIHGRNNTEVNFLAGSVQTVTRFMVPSGRVEGNPTQVSSGTGFIVSAENQILTNHHVVDDCQEIVQEIVAGLASAKLVADDSVNDLALLSVSEEESLGEGSTAGSTAVFRSGPPLRKGEGVIVAG